MENIQGWVIFQVLPGKHISYGRGVKSLDLNRPAKCVRYLLFKNWNKSHCLLRVSWMPKFLIFSVLIWEVPAKYDVISAVNSCDFFTSNMLADPCCCFYFILSIRDVINDPSVSGESLSSQSETELFFLPRLAATFYTAPLYRCRTLWQGQSEVILLEWVKGVEDCWNPLQ
jgi:hypothetical protein